MLVKSIDNYSKDFHQLQHKIQRTKKIHIANFNMDYLGMLIKVLNTKKVLVLTDDQIKARQYGLNLADWGLSNAVLPSSWSQIDRDYLANLSNEITNINSSSGGVLVSGMEEFKEEWLYHLVDAKKLEVGYEYGFTDLSKKLYEWGYTAVKKLNMEGEYSIKGDVWSICTHDKKNYRLSFYGKKLEKIILVKDGLEKQVEQMFFPGLIMRTEDKKTGKLDVLKNIDFDLVVEIGEVDLSGIKYEKSVSLLQIVEQNAVMVKWPMEKMIFNLGGQKNFQECLEKFKIEKSIVATKHPEEFRRWVTQLKMSFADFEIVDQYIPIGGIIRNDKIAIWSDRELFGENLVKHDAKKSKVSFKKLAEYKIGDLVVHIDHGVGILKDFTTREIGDVTKDYLVIGYDRGDLLYVPVEQLNKISKYIGSRLAKLNRLGGSIWQKRKRKARRDVEKIAKELLRLYAKRKLVKRKPYEFKRTVQTRLNESFDYNLTVDQEVAMDEINADLSNSYPMDRLLCGDVGFGKTELAIRIAARVAANKKQVALLAPTTILCEQHFVTFVSRLSGLGLRVEVLSRLRDKKYQDNVIRNIEDGKVDIVIGTHRLLQKDIVFKDLGMLIIDEEQKFGVRAKEKLKEIRSDIDVLSMSATPIPRTLNISMGGVRDMSILEMAPPGRQTIDTEIMQFKPMVVKEAIERELARGGQVYIVHNRVRTIEKFKNELVEILGEGVSIGVAHGQMTEYQLADTMSKFATNKYQVLLATTIVENGLDLPNVNTLIVENASGLGLSQLYQLRGRVGRSDKKAYAYFLYRSDKLKTKAKQRLSAISEATELGSGLKLAISDMEIRGVGNVLGVEQHGNAYSVGLGMFLDMLEEKVAKLKSGENFDFTSEDELVVELPINVYLPKYYIDDKEERLYWEQKILVQSKPEDVDQVVYEMQKKHGAIGIEVKNLATMAKLKLSLAKFKIKSVSFVKNEFHTKKSMGEIVFEFVQELSMSVINKLYLANPNWIIVNNKVKIELSKLGEEWLSELNRIFSAI